VGKNADLLREGRVGVYAVVTDWWKQGVLKDNALEAAARDYHASVVQLALAWLLHRSPAMLPIPGTSSVAHLEENMAAAKLKLTAEDWKRVDALASWRLRRGCQR